MSCSICKISEVGVNSTICDECRPGFNNFINDIKTGKINDAFAETYRTLVSLQNKMDKKLTTYDKVKAGLEFIKIVEQNELHKLMPWTEEERELINKAKEKVKKGKQNLYNKGN